MFAVKVETKNYTENVPGLYGSQNEADEACVKVATDTVRAFGARGVTNTENGWQVFDNTGTVALVYVSEIVADECGHDSCHGRKVCLYTY